VSSDALGSGSTVATALAVSWFATVFWSGWHLRPRPPRRRPVPGATARPALPPRPARRLLPPRFVPMWWLRLPVTWRTGAVVGVVLAPFALVALVAAPATGVAWHWFAARRRLAKGRAAVERSLPEAADLLAIALDAGLGVRQALVEAARWSPDPVGAELRATVRDVDRGRTLDEALQAAGDRLGPAAEPLVLAVTASERLGIPIVDSLRQFVAELAHQRRMAAEARARQLPVRLSLPLVLLVLPAFGLLTVAPTLFAAFGGLGVPAAP